MQPLETARPEAPQLRRFHDLYRGEFAFVWSAAQHLGVPSGAVADVVQDVFLTAYRRLDHLRFEVSPRAWLYGVTRRVAYRYRRGAARLARRHAAYAELARPAMRAPQQRHEDVEQLHGLLGRLGEGTRVVWEMTELLGMSAPEIASELELPLNTVYSRLRLARKQLQEIVADTELAGWRDAAREQQAPPHEAERRTWALLLPAFGKAAGGTGVAVWMASKQAVATTLIAFGAVAVGLVVARPSPPAPVEPRAVSAAPLEQVRAPLERAPAPGVVVPVPEDMSPRPRRAAPVSGGALLAEEILVIDRLQAQLGAGEVAAALATIAEHERRFPAGALVDVREAARAQALCRAGDRAAAEAVARKLVQEHPGSAVAQRFNHENYFCRGDGSMGGTETRG